MTQPDYVTARNYVRTRMESELPANLTYHNIDHTFEDVLPAVEKLAELIGISEEEKLLLRTGALFHDIGFVESPINHEATSVNIARKVLPRFGYSNDQIDEIAGIIMATRLPQKPRNTMEKIMADADLDVFGRDDFSSRNQALRAEMVSQGRHFTDLEWYTTQIDFMEQHEFFTATARRQHNFKKTKNLQQLQRMLKAATAQEKHPSQLNISERIAILRTVSLFAETPEYELEEIAHLLRPLKTTKGETIFNKGDSGDCMYMIIRGRISIHDGDMLLNHLGPGDVFGEMALLDAQPRVASATATEDTALFQLTQEPFYDLMAHRSEVSLGIIRVLNQHLRRRVRERAADYDYIQQVNRITAAAGSLEAGLYVSSLLDEVCQRQDELGQLARVFQKMADEVQAREKRLKQELTQLRIMVDEAKRAQAVAEIVETDYFQELESRVWEMRKRRWDRQSDEKVEG